MDLHLFKDFPQLYILQKISYSAVPLTLLSGYASLMGAAKIIVALGFWQFYCL